MPVTWKTLFLQRAPLDLLFEELKKCSNWPRYEIQQEIVDILSLSSPTLTSSTSSPSSSSLTSLSPSSPLPSPLAPSLSISRPPSRWLKSFLKIFLHEIENQNEEIHDSLAEMMITITSFEEEEGGSIIFPLPSGSFVHIYSKNIYNQVGMTIWTAGILMTDLLVRVHLCKDRNILELGSGTGLTGIIVGLAANPKKIILTDFHPEVMTNLQQNILLNSSQDLPSDRISSFLFDWVYYSDQDINFLLRELSEPIILAADCVYSKDLGFHLVNIVCHLLFSSLQSQPLRSFVASPSPNPLISSSSFPYALITQTVRQAETYQYFLSYLEDTLMNHPKYRGLLGWGDLTDWAREIAPKTEREFYYDSTEEMRVIWIHPLVIQQES
jgi:predicted nicotinamide N-methyase